MGKGMAHRDWGRVLKWGMICGLVLTIFGIVGNRVVLRADWDALHAAVTTSFAPPYPRIVRELISISFDFVAMVAMVWVFSRFADRSLSSAMKLTVVWWLVSLALLYLAMVNSSMMPWRLSLDTTIVGLIGALAVGPIMWWGLRNTATASIAS
jgi:hypothetical protein